MTPWTQIVTLIIKTLFLFSLIAATLIFGSVMFNASSPVSQLKVLLLMPGLLWACWLAGNEVRDESPWSF